MPEYRSYGARDDRVTKDGDVGFIGFNNRLRPDQLQAGMLADAQNIRLDRNGEVQVRRGVELVSEPLAVGADSLTLPFNLPTAGEIGNGTTAILDDDAVNEIYGSCGYSDPNAAASQYIIFASNTKAIAINIATGAETDIDYPAGLNISQPVDMIQAFNKVYIFREGKTALEWNGDLSQYVSIVATESNGGPNSIASGTYSYWRMNEGKPQYRKLVNGVAVADIFWGFRSYATTPAWNIQYYSNGVYAESSEDVATPDLVQNWSILNPAEGYTYSTNHDINNISITSSPAFTKVASGAYSQPTQLSPSRVDITDGKATATFSSIAAMNGTAVGDTIEIEAIGNSPLVVGEKYVVAERDDSVPSLSFFVQHQDTSNAQGVIFQQPVSVGLGFTHMPAPPFAIYHQRRLVMPYRFTVDTAADSFTARGILDEVIASDILDSDTYDQIYAQYRFNAGTADFVVGLHSFAEDRLLVFNRNSIHLVENTTNLQGASTRLLTNEVGCVARKSIVQVGNQVIFLSDNGIYGTQFLDEYNLRGTETPLSESINTTIQRINRNAWQNSVAVYFDNRYFIAVPLDDSTSNNAILVYNFLNKQWESVDQVGDSNFHSTNLIVVGDGDARAVYAVNDIGGVHRLDSRVDGIDRVITQIGGNQQNLGVGGSITTRQYTLGTLDRKRWKEFDIHAQSSEDNTSDFDIGIETENPDTVESLGSLSTFNGSALAVGEDVSIRGRIGNRRGYGLQFTINNTSGRPRIRAIETEGSTAMRSTQKAI